MPAEATTVAEGERKTVTALFADIKGSTELEQDLDPEEARAIVIEIARRQGSKSFELRATACLARLLRETNRSNEARAMLADSYNCFTEGFETRDLRDAKALLAELGR
jgi:predicted ATPase